MFNTCWLINYLVKSGIVDEDCIVGDTTVWGYLAMPYWGLSKGTYLYVETQKGNGVDVTYATSSDVVKSGWDEKAYECSDFTEFTKEKFVKKLRVKPHISYTHWSVS